MAVENTWKCTLLQYNFQTFQTHTQQGFIQWGIGGKLPKASPQTHADQCRILAATLNCLRNHNFNFREGWEGDAPRPYTCGSANYAYMPTPSTELLSENVILLIILFLIIAMVLSLVLVFSQI